jgi:hypothetical protein
MNLEHAVQTIAKRGFTDRQARFLVLVARHSGVCVMRQYSSFAGIVFGQKTRKFFANLVRLGFVSTYDCAHNRGRVYHVRHRAIYEAIVEPDSRVVVVYLHADPMHDEFRDFLQRHAPLLERLAARVDYPNRGSGAPGGRGAGPAEGRVGTTRVAAEGADPHGAALVFRPHRQPTNRGEPGC